MEVILVIDIQGPQDKTKFEKYLKREGFHAIDTEEFSYQGETTTHQLNTKLYIFDVVKQGILKVGFKSCKIIFQIGEYPLEAYIYDEDSGEFDALVDKIS